MTIRCSGFRGLLLLVALLGVTLSASASTRDDAANLYGRAQTFRDDVQKEAGFNGRDRQMVLRADNLVDACRNFDDLANNRGTSDSQLRRAVTDIDRALDAADSEVSRSSLRLNDGRHALRKMREKLESMSLFEDSHSSNRPSNSGNRPTDSGNHGGFDRRAVKESIHSAEEALKDLQRAIRDERNDQKYRSMSRDLSSVGVQLSAMRGMVELDERRSEFMKSYDAMRTNVREVGVDVKDVSLGRRVESAWEEFKNRANTLGRTIDSGGGGGGGGGWNSDDRRPEDEDRLLKQVDRIIDRTEGLRDSLRGGRDSDHLGDFENDLRQFERTLNPLRDALSHGRRSEMRDACDRAVNAYEDAAKAMVRLISRDPDFRDSLRSLTQIGDDLKKVKESLR